MADKKITELDVAEEIFEGDVSILVRDGVDYQFTFSILLEYMQSNLNAGCQALFGAASPSNSLGANGDIYFRTQAEAISIYKKISGTWASQLAIPVGGPDGCLLFGAGVPDSDTGKTADAYINTSTGVFYKKGLSTWTQMFSMATGPAGAKGDDGENGTNGTNGSTVLHGTASPSNTTDGVNGDFYLKTTTYQMFGPKAGGVWGSGTSLFGPGLPTGGSTGQILRKNSGDNLDAIWSDEQDISGKADISYVDSADAGLLLAINAVAADLASLDSATMKKNGTNVITGDQYLTGDIIMNGALSMHGDLTVQHDSNHYFNFRSGGLEARSDNFDFLGYYGSTLLHLSDGMEGTDRSYITDFNLRGTTNMARVNFDYDGSGRTVSYLPVGSDLVWLNTGVKTWENGSSAVGFSGTDYIYGGKSNAGGWYEQVRIAKHLFVQDDGTFAGIGYSSDPTSGNRFGVNGNSHFGGSVSAIGFDIGSNSLVKTDGGGNTIYSALTIQPTYWTRPDGSNQMVLSGGGDLFAASSLTTNGFINAVGAVSSSGFNIVSETHLIPSGSNLIIKPISSGGYLIWGSHDLAHSNMVLDDSGNLTVRGDNKAGRIVTEDTVTGLSYKITVDSGVLTASLI